MPAIEPGLPVIKEQDQKRVEGKFVGEGQKPKPERKMPPLKMPENIPKEKVQMEKGEDKKELKEEKKKE